MYYGNNKNQLVIMQLTQISYPQVLLDFALLALLLGNNRKVGSRLIKGGLAFLAKCTTQKFS